MADLQQIIDQERERLGETNTPLEVARGVPELQVGTTEANAMRTNIFTYFTVVGDTHLIHSSHGWSRVRLTLEDAGPVAISTRDKINPVLSGRGVLLLTNVEKEFVLSNGDRLWITAAAVNRVSVIIEPIPWLQSLALNIESVGSKVVAAGEKVTGAIFSLKAKVGGKRAAKQKVPPCPPTQHPMMPKKSW